MLEIVVGSIARSPSGKVAVGIPDSMKSVREKHAEKWVLGMGFLYIQSAYVSSRVDLQDLPSLDVIFKLD